MEGDNRLAAWFSHAARSHLVDRRYFTPSPAADWRAGKIQKENTEKEENFIQAVLRICDKEKIDTIFPSFDPHVYVFSKNKERFKRLGILIPIPDYETVLTTTDKYRTIQAAQEVGFPCPRTYLAESDEDLKRISEELGFPLVVKPRFTAAGRGTEMVTNLPELLENSRRGSEEEEGLTYSLGLSERVFVQRKPKLGTIRPRTMLPKRWTAWLRPNKTPSSSVSVKRSSRRRWVPG
jgi:glutathione synthase/RimK-type ligase-like ATP-grasp enzyme